MLPEAAWTTAPRPFDHSHDMDVERAEEPADATTTEQFYRRLLDLNIQREVDPLLGEALRLVVEVTDAAIGYLELHAQDENKPPRYWRAVGATEIEVESIRSAISRGIIAHAVVEGRTIETPSAIGDARFEDLGSVRQNQIGSVLCVPIGSPAIGVLYLQGCRGRFSVQDQFRLELFARQLAPLADRLVNQEEPASADHTRQVRELFRCAEIVGRSAQTAKMLGLASNLSKLDVDVLITGPGGSGKALLARTIWANSTRASGPFIEVVCDAPNLDIDDQLQAAAGGVALLRDIGALNAQGQAHLLAFLVHRERTAPVVTRLIATSKTDLYERVKQGAFREDLFFRLRPVPVSVVGLRHRGDDLRDLVEHLVATSAARHGFERMRVAPQAIAACRDAAWPGNILELAQVLEVGVVRAAGQGSETINDVHLFPERGDTKRTSLQEMTKAFQRQLMIETLEANDWNISEAAKTLGVARSFVYSLVGDVKARSRK